MSAMEYDSLVAAYGYDTPERDEYEYLEGDMGVASEKEENVAVPNMGERGPLGASEEEYVDIWYAMGI